MQLPSWAVLLATVACLLAVGQLPETLAVQINRIGKTCQEYPVEAREEMANVVISGYINKIMRKPRTIMYDCDVEVVRVFKGYDQLQSNVVPPMDGNHLQIGGFGDPTICDNRVHPGDTRIFMLNKKNGGHLMLNSSVIRITLNNLVQAEAAVYDVPFVTKRPVRKGPCDMVLCIFGAVCIENEVGRPQCICDMECPDTVAPVCGSDGVTYLSTCFLDMASCEQKRRITVKAEGACDEIDPCDNIECTHGAGCVVEGSRARCVCPELCLTSYQPICGSDDVSYDNMCELEVARCVQQKNITLAYDGACEEKDPCDSMDCSFGAECVVEGSAAQCLCPEICLTEYSPVCGSDAVDYNNECELNMAACNQQKNITVIYEGKCDPCQSVDYAAICKLSRGRAPMPICNISCTIGEFEPICGSDGYTYDNECLLRRSACINNLEGVLVKFTDGPCETGTHPCDDHQCEFGACMVDDSGMPECVCPTDCPEVYSPVCGSDGKTYNSPCHLESQSCLTETIITEVAAEACTQEIKNLCESLECLFGSTCVVENGAASCSCEVECREGESTPVCGTDNVDYPSLCAMRQAACEQQTDIQVSTIGFCESCQDITCSYGAFCKMSTDGPTCVCSDRCQPVNLPVCGSDGQTYSSECKLNVIACNQQKNITVASYGTCEDCAGVVCDTERYNQVCYQGTCVCKSSCPSARSDEDKVCGSDDKTYDTVCHLKATACERESSLEVAYYGPCEEFSGSGGEISGSGEIPIDEEVCDETSCGFGGVCRPLSATDFECVCKFNCPAIRYPVCGTDDVTYGNMCQLKEAACEQQSSIVLSKIGTCEDVEMEPCDGDQPLMREGTSELYNCTEDNGGEDCPSGSYCHIHPMGTFTVCCAVSGEQTSVPTCVESTYGCCPDNKTEALGENYAGCPSICNCNEMGSYSIFCEPLTQQCPCKPGVGGKQCDRCEPGYFDFASLNREGSGCKPCGCSKSGSRRDDCDQGTGACICKKKAFGLKCERCPEGMVMTQMGCMTEEEQVTNTGLTCANLTCRHYSTCQEPVREGGNASCVCPSSCPAEFNLVCGDNGETYGSQCQLEMFACRNHQDIMVQSVGACETVGMPPTEPSTLPGCIMTEFGCCPDNVTVAEGPNFVGCAGGGNRADSGPLKIGTTAIVTMVMGCDSSPCLHGGTCVNDEITPGFTCHCPVGKGGPVCGQVVTFDTPSFAGESYLAFAMMDSAFLEVEIIIEFQPNATEGVLLYEAQDEEGRGDFISLALVNGRVEFRFQSTDQSNGFDLGPSEPVVIRSTVEIEPMKWHRLRAYRNRRQGTLSVDDEPEVAGESLGVSGALNLMQDLYIGHAIPPEVGLQLVNTNQGFVGCIRHVEINGNRLDLSSAGPDIEYGANVGECGNDPCKGEPCLNNGTCQAVNAETYRCHCIDNFLGPLCGDVLVDQCQGNMCHQGSTCVPLAEGGYHCDCPQDWMGDFCNEEISGVYVPGFTGNSHIELPSLRMPKSIQMQFLTTSPNGVLLYNGQSTDGRGDFISLNLRDGYLELRYDLGTGIANIRSSDRLNLDEWHSVSVMRDSREGQMTLNDLPPVTGSSNGGASQLNLRDPLFVGGVRNYDQVSRKASLTDGLQGAIRQLIVNGMDYMDFKELALTEVNVIEFKDESTNMVATMMPAMRSPTISKVPPEPIVRTTARAAPRATTSRATTTASVQVVDVNDPVYFDGRSAYTYYNGVTQRSRALRAHELQLSFKTDQPNGVLLWNGLGSRDFQAVGVVEGHAEFAYNLGGGVAKIRSSQFVNDNQWHTVFVRRVLLNATLQLDNSPPIMTQARKGATQLDTDGYLYLGEGRSVQQSMANNYIPYIGCIRDVSLNEDDLHLYDDAKGTKPSQFCSEP